MGLGGCLLGWRQRRQWPSPLSGKDLIEQLLVGAGAGAGTGVRLESSPRGEAPRHSTAVTCVRTALGFLPCTC